MSAARTEDEDDDEIFLPEELNEFYINRCTKLGSGAFSTVFLAEHRATKEMVAVKVMNKERMKKKNNLHRFRCEVEALKSLMHQNICQLYQVHENDEYVSLVLEHCPGGELFDYIVSKKKLPENEARTFFRQIVSAVAYIHQSGYAHRDIKPDNLLLNNEKMIKMIDFGLSVKPASGLSVPLLTRVGSPAFAAPEIVSGNLYFGDQADIWSLGVLLYTVLCGRLPFIEDTTAKLYELIKIGVYFQPKHLSQGSAKLIKRMLEVDPKKRITMKELLEDDWLTNNNELPAVSSESILQASSIDENLVKEVADALEMSIEDIKFKIEEKEYGQVMAHYLLLIKKKENEIRKFQLIYGLSNQDMERLLLLGASASNMTTRQRSQSEQRWLTKMMDEMENDDDEFLDVDEAGVGSRKKSHFGTFPRKINSKDSESTKPLLTLVEQIPMTLSPEMRRHNFDEVESRPGAIAKQRSSSKLNELMSAVFKLEEKPRRVKGFYHMANTSTKTAEEIRKELTRVLEELVSYSLLQSFSNPKKFLFRCKSIDENELKVVFEIEVCTIPKVENVFGIRNKRLSGDIWFYKRLVEQVFFMLKL